MKRYLAVAVLVTAVIWIAGARVATATLPMQKKAKEAGMKEVTCQTCHVEKLPKKGAVTHNDKGKWLVAEKDRRKAKEVDVAWLKDYVPPK